MSKLLDSKMRDPDEDNNGLDLSLPKVRTIHEFKERLNKLQRLKIREACRFKGQIELSKTREQIQQSKMGHLHHLDARKSVTLESYLNKMFSYKNQIKRFVDLNYNLEVINHIKETKKSSMRGSLPQRMRYQIEIDAQIAYQLQAEEQAIGQQLSIQTDNGISRNLINQPLQFL